MEAQASKPFSVLIVGDIHQGKSQLIEAFRDKSDTSVIGPDILEIGGVRANASGTTKGCPSYWGPTIEGRCIKIFDSPGISDGTAFLGLDDDAPTGTGDAQADPNTATAAGAGGLLKLLEMTFEANQINLVIVVHPANSTGVLMGTRFLQSLLDIGLVQGNDGALENIAVVFTKADHLDHMTGKQRKAMKQQLTKTVLPLYFPHLFSDSDPGGSGEDASVAETRRQNQYCFTKGIPVQSHPQLNLAHTRCLCTSLHALLQWPDEEMPDEDDEDDEEMNRPEVKDIDTSELHDLIARIIRERPDFHHRIRKLGEDDYKVILNEGFKNAFVSTEALSDFLKGVNESAKRIKDLETNKKELSGDANITEERRRIAKLLPNETNTKRVELETRDAFLFSRSTQKGYGKKKGSVMPLRMLEDEYIAKGHIAQRPSSGRYPHKAGFRYLCPPGGRRGDIAWALYEKATFNVDGFDGRIRVDFVPVSSPRIASASAAAAARSGPVAAAPAAAAPAAAASDTAASVSKGADPPKGKGKQSVRQRPELAPEGNARSCRGSTRSTRQRVASADGVQ